MSFESTNKKLNESVQRITKNTGEIDNLVKTDLQQKDENFTKKVQTIQLIKGYNFQFGTFLPGGGIDARIKKVSGGPGNTDGGGVIVF